jgi:ABC-type dipeptide/oligopeptide/nickel transport system permease subunit
MNKSIQQKGKKKITDVELGICLRKGRNKNLAKVIWLIKMPLLCLTFVMKLISVVIPSFHPTK